MKTNVWLSVPGQKGGTERLGQNLSVPAVSQTLRLRPQSQCANLQSAICYDSAATKIFFVQKIWQPHKRTNFLVA